MDYLMAIDCGSTTSKAVIFSSDGTEVGIGSAKTPFHYPKPGWVEKDPDGMWSNAAEAVKGALRTSGINPAHIACIAATSYGNGIFCLDENLQPTRNGIHSGDTRAAGTVKQLIDEGLFDKTFPLTANQIWSGSSPILMRWIKDNEPEVYKNTRYVCNAKDYIKYKLTGELTVDHTDFSGCGFIATWEYSYRKEIQEHYGIPEVFEMFPPLLNPWDIAGKVTKDCAAQTGLVEGTPVAAAGVDYGMTTLGSGGTKAEQLCFIVGTWSMNMLIIDKPVYAPNILVVTTYAAPDRWILVDASPSSATNLDWFVEQFCHWEKMEGQKRGVSPFEIVNEEVKNMDPSSCDIICHPFLYGSNIQPTARAGFYGLGGWHTRADVLRAVMEGVCFSHRSHIDKLNAVKQSKQAFIAGGGKRSAVWTQMFSDILNTPLTVPEGDELGALGCAISAAVAVGIYSDHETAVNNMCSVLRQQEPNPEAHEIYAKKYEIYNMLLNSMGSAWDTMHEQIQKL